MLVEADMSVVLQPTDHDAWVSPDALGKGTNGGAGELVTADELLVCLGCDQGISGPCVRFGFLWLESLLTTLGTVQNIVIDIVMVQYQVRQLMQQREPEAVYPAVPTAKGDDRNVTQMEGSPIYVGLRKVRNDSQDHPVLLQESRDQ